MDKPKRGEIYKHFKGGTYQILGYALCSETQKDLILYKSFKEETVWARPLELFTDIHPDHNVKRFEKVGI